MAPPRQLALSETLVGEAQYRLSVAARESPVRGHLRHLFLAQRSGTPMLPVEEAGAEASRGLVGDRHGPKRPGGKRQVLLLEAASLESLRLPPGALKENLVVEGVPLEALPPGQRLLVGDDVVMELSEPCVPCHKLEALRPGLLEESWGRRGVLARVLRSGRLRMGDPVRLLDVNAEAPRPIRPKLP